MGRKVLYIIGKPSKAETLGMEPRLDFVSWGGLRVERVKQTKKKKKTINFKVVLNEMNFKFNFTKKFVWVKNNK